MSDTLLEEQAEQEEQAARPKLRRRPRARLHTAIEAVKEAQSRVGALEKGQDRAREQERTAYSRLHDFEETLATAKREQSQNLAYSYINDADPGQEVTSAEARVSEAKKVLERAQEIEAALAEELEWAQTELRNRQRALREAIEAVVADSPEIARLFAQLKGAWYTLRTIRTCFYEIRSYLPHPLFERWQSVEPLEERVQFPIDKAMVERWRNAFEALKEDPDAELPQI